jgi:hypothetical protein
MMTASSFTDAKLTSGSDAGRTLKGKVLPGVRWSWSLGGDCAIAFSLDKS